MAPLTINHQGQFPAVTLSFNLAPGTALSEAVERSSVRPSWSPLDARRSFQGTAQIFQSSLSRRRS